MAADKTHISQHLIKPSSNQGLMHTQEILSKKLNRFTEQEQTILKVKYSKPIIKLLKKDELAIEAKSLLLKIHIITGWELPTGTNNETTAILQNVLQDQFIKKLTENYSNVNVAEIEFAFRNYGYLIKDWGKNLNLRIIDEVMIEYLKSRKDISDVEENINVIKDEKKPTDEQIQSANRQSIEEYYQDFLSGKNRNVKLYPNYATHQLYLDGLCSDNLHHDFLNEAKDITRKDLVDSIEEYKQSKKHTLAQSFQKELDNLSLESDKVISLSKKMALNHFFKIAKCNNLKNIYIKC